MCTRMHKNKNSSLLSVANDPRSTVKWFPGLDRGSGKQGRRISAHISAHKRLSKYLSRACYLSCYTPVRPWLIECLLWIVGRRWCLGKKDNSRHVRDYPWLSTIEALLTRGKLFQRIVRIEGVRHVFLDCFARDGDAIAVQLMKRKRRRRKKEEGRGRRKKEEEERR